MTVVAIRQQAQHRGVVQRSGLTQAEMAQRDDRGGGGVERVDLVGAAGVGAAAPRRGRAFLRPPAELSEARTTRNPVRSVNHQGSMCSSTSGGGRRRSRWLL
jgi:hypothetical protein